MNDESLDLKILPLLAVASSADRLSVAASSGI
jgi:hypothetical protein